MINSFTARPQLRLRTVFFSLWFAGAIGFLNPAPSLAVKDGPSRSLIAFPLRVTSAPSLPPATVGAFYNFQLSAAGGTPPYNWARAPLSGPLPGGLALSSSGSLSGTPVSSGIFRFAVQVSDSERRQTETNFSLIISNASAIPPGIGEFGLVKHLDYFQNSSSPPIVAANDPFVVFGFIRLTTPNSVAGASLQRPDGSTRLLKVVSNGEEFYFEQRFATKAALDFNYPNGTYIFTVNTPNGPRSLPPLAWFGDAYPQPPRLANFEAAQTFNPRTDFTLSWDPFPGGTLDDFVELAIFSPTGQQLYGSGEVLNGTSTSFVIPANRLQAGQTYFGSLAIAKIVSTNKPGAPASSSPGVAGHQSETRFPLLQGNVAPSSLTIGPDILPVRAVDLFYDAQLSASGGVAPFKWSIIKGELPPGLVLNPAEGTIRGFSEQTGQFPLTIGLRDGRGASAEKMFTIVIEPTPEGFPIAVSRGRESAFSAAFDGSNYLVGILGNETNPSAIAARLVSAKGGILGPRIEIGRSGGPPMVSFDGNNYLLVWQDDAIAPNDDVYGQFISRSGALIGRPFAISTAPGRQSRDWFSGLIFDGANYLVIWRDERKNPDDSDIYGQFISPAGSLVGPEIPILTSGADEPEGALAFGAGTYLVTSMRRQPGPSEVWDVVGAFLNRDGAVSSPFVISQTSSERPNPLAIGFNGTDFLVGWTLYHPSLATPAIFARLVTPLGSFPRTQFLIVSSATDHIFPTITSIGNNFLVSWPDPGSNVSKSQVLDSAGNRLGREFIPVANHGSRTSVTILFPNSKSVFALTTLADFRSIEGKRIELLNADVYGSFLSLPTGSVAVKTIGLPSGQVNQGYAFDLEAFGGSAPYAWSITPNSLPPGLAFDPATGQITGVPSSPGSFSLNVRVTDTLGQSAEMFLPLIIAPAQAGFSILDFSEASASGAAFDGKTFLVSFETRLPDGRSALGAQLLSARGTAVGAPIMVDREGDAPLVAFDGANYLLVWADHTLGPGVPVFGQLLTPTGEKVGAPFQISQSGGRDRPNGVAFNGINFLVIWTRQTITSEVASAPNVFGRFVTRGGIVVGNDFQISGTSGKFGSIGFDGTNFLVVWTDKANNQIRARFVIHIGLSGLEFSISPRTSAVIESRSALAFDGRNYLVVWNDESLLAGATKSQDLYGQIISKDGTLVESTIRINGGRGAQLRPFLAFDGFNHLITWTDARNDSNGNFICDPGEGSCLDILGQFVSRSGKPLGPVFPVAADPGNQTESPLVYGAGKYFAVWTSSGATAREQEPLGGSQLRGTFINPLGPVIAPTLPARTVAVGSDVTLTVDVAGQEPLFYQWQFQGTNLPGQTNVTLTVSNVQASVAGIYTLVVSNRAGVSSTTISVVALDPPVIISQPGSQTASAGGNLTLQVFAAGTEPLRYRWRLNGVNIPDATNSTLVLGNLQSSNSGVYSVVVANRVAATSSQPARLKVSSGPVLPPLLFDNFNNRFTTNTPGSGTVIGDNTGATQEPGEPIHDRKRGGKSVWFSWVAPGGGTARFNTKGSSIDTVLAVYTGTSVADLTRVTSDDDQGDFFTSAVTFKARDGVAYQIAIDGRGGAEGEINLNWQFEFGVEDIPQIVTQPRGQTVDLGADVQLTASIAVADEINTRPVLAYQWFFNGQPLPGATDTTLTLINFQSAQVGTYRLAVTQTAIGKTFLSDPATLEIGLAATATSADKFEDLLAELAENPPLVQSFRRKKAYASVSAGSIGTQTMDNFGSTTEEGEPNHGGVIGGASRWFTLIPRTNGIMILDTIGSDIDTVLAVYRGNNLFNLTVVASDDNGAPDGVRSLVKFNARKGTNYLVAIDGVNGAQGNIRLNWKLGIAPAISQRPTNQNVPMGGTISLAVLATAIPTPVYQWRLDGVDLFGATNSVLILENFQEGNQGNYNVVASNFAGTVSAAAVLSLSLPQQLSGLTSNGLFTLQLTAQPAQTYVIQASSNLIDWTSIFTNSPQNGSFTFTDAESANLLRRFYRSFLLSIP